MPEEGVPPAPKRPDEDLRAPPSPLELANRRLLVDEIAKLERLVAATRSKSPDRAGLVRRLADAYAELAALSAKELTLREMVLEEVAREEARAKATEKGAPKASAPANGPPRRTKVF